jgi:hypothetical protein
MQEDRVPSRPSGCGSACATLTSIEELNHSCYCLNTDSDALKRLLETDLQQRGVPNDMTTTHPHLFASVPMFISRAHLERMSRVISAVEAVVATPHFQAAALAWAPDIARFEPGPLGGLLGYDFHLSAAGPQLIEINTNPGGALLNVVLGRAQESCCREATGLAMAPMDAQVIEDALFEVFMTEWRLQRKDAPFAAVAIIDESPEQQYLYPEFCLYERLFRRHGIEATICDPRTFLRKDAQLWNGNGPVDFVYNRLTDFSFEQPAQAVLKGAYLAGEVVVSPHPRAHALYADKRNLTLLCAESFLRATGANEESIGTLLAAVPRTVIMTPDNRETLWASRRDLFFKPSAGYGSKATYRGDKLTKRVWEQMKTGSYVAQSFVAPSERLVAASQSSTALKVDVRCYSYAGAVKLVAARLYKGQTTNFRTPGGGFAPVFTETPERAYLLGAAT